MPRRYSSFAFAFLVILLAIGGCGGDSAQNFATCGNGVIDTGERCDDGNTSDSDACTSACQPARCGDGVVEVRVEQCDGFLPTTTNCGGLGFGAGTLVCSAACQVDTSRCGAPLTPTSTPTNTPTPAATSTGTATATPSATLPTGQPTFTATPSLSPTASPTPTQAPCGDGVLRPGEVCTCSPDDEACMACPEDCVVQPCAPTAETVEFAFHLVSPPGMSATGATVRLGYPSSLVSIPGTGSQRPVFDRVVPPEPPPVPFFLNDADYAVSVVLGRTTPISELFTVTFDRCAGAREVTVDDFGCAIVGCAAGGGPIEGCACTVRTP